MVIGIDIFRDRFRQFTGDLTLIGGAACDEWFTAQGLEFRATRDLDIVVMLEDLKLGKHSLSALLLDDDYYRLVQTHHDLRDGLWVANATSLIPLKAYAWLNLTKAKSEGEAIDSANIRKHRNDVFRLAGTLPGNPGPELPARIRADLNAFLGQFGEDSAHWPSILAAIRNTLGGTIRPAALRSAIQRYFRLSAA